MGLFDKIFEKKLCSVCGGEIGLLGNRKLEDGNLCKECAKKLSPWFDDRRHSTVDQIKEQLAYREANRKEVEKFHTTRTLGSDMKILLDEDACKFMVTRERNLVDANPDVLDFSQVTGVRIDVDEDTREDKTTDKDGNRVSYTPPRYFYSYDFKVIINVNHPYFDEIDFDLSSSSVETNPNASVPAARKPVPTTCREYRDYDAMGKDIKDTLTGVRNQVREAAAAAAAPKTAVTCPWCGATTMPNASGQCEYCGGAINGD